MWRVLLVLCVACGGDPALPGGVARFDGTEPTPATADLAPLWRLIGDARIVGLGESVHTSGGFYAVKERVIRAMIEERGVRVIAFETPRDRARALDAYLVSGACDRPARDVFGHSVFEIFVDDHTYALMRWICERNARRPDDPVHLFGFDIQQSDEDGPEIASFLSRQAPDDAPALQQAVSTCFIDGTAPYTAEQHDACKAGLATLADWIAAHRAVITAAGRAGALFELAFASFRAEQDHYFIVQTDLVGSNEPRDRGMAEVFQRVLALDYPADARVVVWAHNFHLSRAHDRVADTIYTPPHTVSFGTVLAQVYGDAYAPIAITGYAPGTNWPQVHLVLPHTSYGTGDDSVERKLHNLGEPYLIVDPRAGYLSPDRAQPMSEEIAVPRTSFTGILYLDDSPPMAAVFW